MAILTNTTIATVRGQLTLTVGSATVDIGTISIPIDAYPDPETGGLALSTKLDLREVRDYITAVLDQGEARS